ncbi:MAG: hypothetical protein Q7S54_00950, partial [bacterium]|nr:hypothetical protein [bacterium]
VIDVAPKAVLTNVDLQAYAAGAVRSDTRIDEMNFTNETVEVKYEEEGRLLALIPVTFTVSVVAKADGTVEVEYPWYSVITVDKRDRIEVQAKVAVDNALRARLVGSVRAEGIEAEPRFTADESAEVAAQIHAVLKAGLTGDNTVD